MLKVIENSGTSRDEAIVIEADSHVIGVMVEYAYLEKRFGERGKAWQLEAQMLMGSGQPESCGHSLVYGV